MKLTIGCFHVALLLALLSTSALAKTCSAVGGAILTNLGGFGVIDGSPTTLGVATGDLKGALGVQILSASQISPALPCSTTGLRTTGRHLRSIRPPSMAYSSHRDSSP